MTTLYRALAAGVTMTGSGEILLERTGRDPDDVAQDAHDAVLQKPGIDMSTVRVKRVEKYEIDPVLDVDNSNVSDVDILTKAVSAGMVTNKEVVQ